MDEGLFQDPAYGDNDGWISGAPPHGVLGEPNAFRGVEDWLHMERPFGGFDDDWISSCFLDESADLSTQGRQYSADSSDVPWQHMNQQNNGLPRNDSESSLASMASTRSKRHKRLKSGYSCTECLRTFDLRSDLTHHERSHRPVETRPHACSICAKRFMYPKDLRRHSREVHGAMPAATGTTNIPISPTNLYAQSDEMPIHHDPTFFNRSRTGGRRSDRRLDSLIDWSYLHVERESEPRTTSSEQIIEKQIINDDTDDFLPMHHQRLITHLQANDASVFDRRLAVYLENNITSGVASPQDAWGFCVHRYGLDVFPGVQSMDHPRCINPIDVWSRGVGNPLPTRSRLPQIAGGKDLEDTQLAAHQLQPPLTASEATRTTLRGDHGLRRNDDRPYALLRRVWICTQPAVQTKYVPEKSLVHCKQCKQRKQYNVCYNAAAHLRRTHFNPRKRSRKAGQEAEGRAANAGSGSPSIEWLMANGWLEQLDVHSWYDEEDDEAVEHHEEALPQHAATWQQLADMRETMVTFMEQRDMLAKLLQGTTASFGFVGQGGTKTSCSGLRAVIVQGECLSSDLDDAFANIHKRMEDRCTQVLDQLDELERKMKECVLTDESIQRS